MFLCAVIEPVSASRNCARIFHSVSAACSGIYCDATMALNISSTTEYNSPRGFFMQIFFKSTLFELFRYIKHIIYLLLYLRHGFKLWAHGYLKIMNGPRRKRLGPYLAWFWDYLGFIVWTMPGKAVNISILYTVAECTCSAWMWPDVTIKSRLLSVKYLSSYKMKVTGSILTTLINCLLFKKYFYLHFSKCDPRIIDLFHVWSHSFSLEGHQTKAVELYLFIYIGQVPY